MKENRGITLIALVITIIVLLILAGVSISMLSGDNSIISKAGEASDKTIEAQNLEKISIEVLGSYGDDGTIDVEKLKTNLEKIGVNVNGNSLPLSVSYNEVNYRIDSNGKIKEEDDIEDILTDNDYLIVMASSKSKFEGKTNVGTIQEFKTMVDAGAFNYNTAYLYENIELNGSETNMWSSIGTATNKFSKVFDGRNYNVNGIYANSSNQGQALFTYNAGTIKNLTVNGEIKGSADGVGGIVAQNDGIVENCTSNVTIKGREYVGGIVGYGTSTSTIRNCKSTGNIEGEQIVGGIAGGCDGDIIGCTNNGKVKSTSSNSSVSSPTSGLCGTGGITGVEYSGTVSNSKNLGHIEGISNCVGGIVGTNHTASIESCYNDGEILAENGGTGGIVGFQKGSNPSTKYCYNKNKVTSHSNIGGIVGDLSTGSVENCYNIGQVETYQENHTVYNMGGICGRSLSGTNVKNSYTLNSLNLNVVGIPEENTVDSLSSLKSDQEMKADAFLTIINSGSSFFKKGSDYPILNWQ